MKVLIVDDEQVNTQLTVLILQNLGIRNDSITTAENGKEALDLCRNQDFDIVLMDVRMPLMNGVEATKEIKKIKNMYIIAFTTFSQHEIEREYGNINFDGYITKPVKKESLKKVLYERVSN